MNFKICYYIILMKIRVNKFKDYRGRDYYTSRLAKDLTIIQFNHFFFGTS